MRIPPRTGLAVALNVLVALLLWVPPLVYRPPYFPQVYSVGIVWGPAVLVLNSLWSDPVPVWRDRSVVIGAQPVTNVIVTGARTPRPVIWQHDPNHRRNVEYRRAGNHIKDLDGPFRR